MRASPRVSPCRNVTVGRNGGSIVVGQRTRGVSCLENFKLVPRTRHKVRCTFSSKPNGQRDKYVTHAIDMYHEYSTRGAARVRDVPWERASAIEEAMAHDARTARLAFLFIDMVLCMGSTLV